MEGKKEQPQKHLSAHESRMLRHQEKNAVQEQVKHSAPSSSKSYTKYYAIAGVIAVIAIYLLFFRGGSSNGPSMPTIGNHPHIGLDSSTVNIQIFGDFQCPFTKQFYDEDFQQILDTYGTKARIEFHPMPTGKHNYDRISAEAAYCANDQGMFWDMTKLLFARQGQGDADSLRSYAEELKLNMTIFNSCLDTHKYKDLVQKDYVEGKDFNVAVTPTIFVNNVMLQGVLPMYQYQRYIDFQLKPQ